jgi:hypothetical protein
VADPGFVEPELYTIFESLFMKNNKHYKYKIRKECKYLIRAPPRALKGARVSEGP